MLPHSPSIKTGEVGIAALLTALLADVRAATPVCTQHPIHRTWFQSGVWPQDINAVGAQFSPTYLHTTTYIHTYIHTYRPTYRMHACGYPLTFAGT